MNSQDEMEQAFADFHDNRLVRKKADMIGA